MEEENKTVETEKITADDYLANLQALKDSTVSKDEYNRLIEENKKLANALANGLPYEQDDKEEANVDVDALRKSFLSNHKSNLELIKDALELRKAVMDEGGVDPALPTNPEYVWNQDDADKSDRIFSILQDCVDYAEGDPDVFNLALAKACGAKMKVQIKR